MRRPPDRDLFAADDDFAGVTCPFCDSGEVTVQSLFGPAPSESLLHCESCRSGFAWVKWRGRLPDDGPPPA